MKSKAEIMRVMRKKRRKAGLKVLSLYVTSENKVNILMNIRICEQCQSAYLIKSGCGKCI